MAAPWNRLFRSEVHRPVRDLDEIAVDAHGRPLRPRDGKAPERPTGAGPGSGHQKPVATAANVSAAGAASAATRPFRGPQSSRCQPAANAAKRSSKEMPSPRGNTTQVH